MTFDPMYEPPRVVAGIFGPDEGFDVKNVYTYDEWGWNLTAEQVQNHVNAWPGRHFHILIAESRVT